MPEGNLGLPVPAENVAEVGVLIPPGDVLPATAGGGGPPVVIKGEGFSQAESLHSSNEGVSLSARGPAPVNALTAPGVSEQNACDCLSATLLILNGEGLRAGGGAHDSLSISMLMRWTLAGMVSLNVAVPPSMRGML